MTVEEAHAFFKDQPSLARCASPPESVVALWPSWM